jgi:RHS repeat-associated protein
VDTGCFNCTVFKSLDSSFYARFGKHPVFTGTNLADSVVVWNDLFARYVNFKTGLDNTWQYYASRFFADSCGIGGLAGNKNTLKICIDSIALNDTIGLLDHITPCQRVRNQAIIKAGLLYEFYKEKALADFKAAYYAQSQLVTESFVAIDTVKEYLYTLYYYDMAGNLIKTVPPKGVNPIWRQTWSDSVNVAKAAGTLLVPTHSLVTRYSYNSLNQVTIQKSPDGGSSRFWYDRLGRLVISQNARQQGLGQVYSYTLYDQFGRISEVGQITGGSAMTETISRDTTSLQSWLSSAFGTRTQLTKTGYDLPYGYIPVSQEGGSLYGEFLTQKNLRNRVSYSAVFGQASDTFPTAATYYTYDIHGNVDTLLQDFGKSTVSPNAMNVSGQRYKKIVYDFDLVSGKVNQVSYQPGQNDAFYHRYSYDAENRLTDVFTGRDSVQLFLFPEREAHYTYYKHGPLARTDIGQLRVQGQDFAYTLQGWIKGVNPAMGGTLTNGTDTTEASPVAQDVYGYSLNYYRGDYKAIGYTPQTHTIIGQLGSNGAALYNGNIAAMAVNIPKLGAARLYNYHYDQLNRIVSMDAFSGLDPVAGTFTPVSLSDYRERVTYDPNGNILTYNRHGDAARMSMDSMLYSYTAGTNRLHRVTDYATDASSGTYAQYNDLKQGQSDNNYQYDQIGNLIYDGSEGITNITWNVYGKIETVSKSGTEIRYVYDASGNRIIKKTPTDTTFYVRDASGNVLSVYSRPVAGTLQQAEIHLYGSSRIGMLTTRSAADTSFNLSGGFVKIKGIKFTRGEKLFELSNHLGNVLVAISDRKIAVQNGTTGLNSHYLADISSAQDYYPFGMSMPGRKYEAQSGYRYGFNGKEKDKDLNSLTAYDYGFRIYNPGIGKFLSVDPLSSSYPFYTPYQYAGNVPIKCIDLDGGEPKDRVQKWVPIEMTINSTRKTYDEIEKDPVLGVYSYSAFYDNVTKQAWFVMKNQDGTYSFWKHNQGADPNRLIQSTSGKNDNGHWAPFKTANQIDAEAGVKSAKVLATFFYFVLASPFAIGPAEVGISAVAESGVLSTDAVLTGIEETPEIWPWVGYIGGGGAAGTAGYKAFQVESEAVTEVLETEGPASELNWSRINSQGQTASEHVELHGVNNLQKREHGVFYGNPIRVTNEAWENKGSLLPIRQDNGNDFYCIPRPNSGYSGGYSGQGTTLNNVTIITKGGTNKVVTSYPSGNGHPVTTPMGQH